MTHIFDRYFAKHGKYASVAVSSGIQKITVEFCPGYIVIRSSPPHSQTVYITRSAAIQLIRKALPLIRTHQKHPYPDHDVPQSMHRAYLDEAAHVAEKREFRRGQHLAARAEAQLRRARLAKKRAARRRAQAD